MFLLLKDFTLWVAISIFFACPIAYYALNKWFENFAYKIGLQWWIFMVAGFTVVVVALVTVGWQTFHAANRNPVEALRNE